MFDNASLWCPTWLFFWHGVGPQQHSRSHHTFTRFLEVVALVPYQGVSDKAHVNNLWSQTRNTVYDLDILFRISKCSWIELSFGFFSSCSNNSNVEMRNEPQSPGSWKSGGKKKMLQRSPHWYAYAHNPNNRCVQVVYKDEAVWFTSFGIKLN